MTKDILAKLADYCKSLANNRFVRDIVTTPDIALLRDVPNLPVFVIDADTSPEPDDDLAMTIKAEGVLMDRPKIIARDAIRMLGEQLPFNRFIIIYHSAKFERTWHVLVERMELMVIGMLIMSKGVETFDPFDVWTAFSLSPANTKIYLETKATSRAKDNMIASERDNFKKNHFYALLSAIRHVRAIKTGETLVRSTSGARSVYCVGKARSNNDITVIDVSADTRYVYDASRLPKGGWTVSDHSRRGHWRTYKSGKRIWVDECKVGKGNTGQKVYVGV